MDRRNFFKLTGTCTGGMLLLPSFLHAFAMQENLSEGDNSIVFVQLKGGNDGLNTFIPYTDGLYYQSRPAIAINTSQIITSAAGMGWHPSLKNFADIQQSGHLSVVQNVGYPKPVRSHFRSQEIWQTAVDSSGYSGNGWLGRFLDSHYPESNPIGAINMDTIDNPALKGEEQNAITVKNPQKLIVQDSISESKLSGNPQLDFVRKVAGSVADGANFIQKAIDKSETARQPYPKDSFSANLEWIAKLIKGGLNSKIYYTSLSGFDTHNNQLATHSKKLTQLNDAIFALYNDLKDSGKIEAVTVVIFSEFGRRVADNGNGTDHGTAAPMFIIGGRTKGKIIGANPNLTQLDNGDLIHNIDFRSVYASLLKDKFSFDPKLIGIDNSAVPGLF